MHFLGLIEKGADVNAKDISGMTPLMYASVKGYIEQVKLLLEKGADVNTKDNKYRKALWWAKEGFWKTKDTRYKEIINLLKATGAK